MSDDAYALSFDAAISLDQEVTGKLEDVTSSVNNVGNKSLEVSKNNVSFTSTLKSSSLGISAAASSATSLYVQFDNLDKIQTRVDQAEKTLTTSKAALLTAQERMNDLTAKGITSGSDYQKAQLQYNRQTKGFP